MGFVGRTRRRARRPGAVPGPAGERGPAALLDLGHELSYAPRTVLLHQSEPSSHVLFVTHGWTKVTAAASNGYEALLALRGPGDIIGESAALTGALGRPP